MAEGIEFVERGCVTHVPGFRSAGVACGIKLSGKLDLALVVSERPCVAAAVFTTNRVQSPTVTYNRNLLQSRAEGVRAVVINSGCANAVTGEQGFADAREMARLVGQELGEPEAAVAVMSTGVIGQLLPMERVGKGIRMAAAAL